jgi:hypothetical protein
MAFPPCTSRPACRAATIAPGHPWSNRPGQTARACAAVNFDDSRFVEILQHGAALRERLAAALAAKGVAGPEVPAVSELGWGPTTLPHPLVWQLPAGASLRDLEKLSAQVRTRAGTWFRAPTPKPELGRVQGSNPYTRAGAGSGLQPLTMPGPGSGFQPLSPSCGGGFRLSTPEPGSARAGPERQAVNRTAQCSCASFRVCLVQKVQAVLAPIRCRYPSHRPQILKLISCPGRGRFWAPCSTPSPPSSAVPPHRMGCDARGTAAAPSWRLCVP